MIAIIDYGMGNSGSIKNMLLRIGVECLLTSDPSIIQKARRIILPGVGSFDAAVQNLRRRGIIPMLNEMALVRKVPVLGICLGMQLMSTKSEEGGLPGLGWIDAETVMFRSPGDHENLRIPHMGWNSIVPKHSHPIFYEMSDNPRFYFVHSYHVRCNDENNVLATTQYGISFHSIVCKENLVGTQFHPEKSHKFGLALLRNFAEVMT